MTVTEITTQLNLKNELINTVGYLWQVQGKEQVSAVQHLGLCDVFCLNSADLNKCTENSNFFVSSGTRGPSALGPLFMRVLHVPVNTPLTTGSLQIIAQRNCLEPVRLF